VSVFKLMRVVFLLSILFVILASTWMTEKQMAAWERPILVTIYPIVADGEKATRRFVEEIDADDFREVNRFFGRASPPYGFAVTPAFRFQLAPVSAEIAIAYSLVGPNLRGSGVRYDVRKDVPYSA